MALVRFTVPALAESPRRKGVPSGAGGKSGSILTECIAAGGAVLDFESLFEEEFVMNPALKDLAESLEDVSAVELAADLRTFLDELK